MIKYIALALILALTFTACSSRGDTPSSSTPSQSTPLAPAASTPPPQTQTPATSEPSTSESLTINGFTNFTIDTPLGDTATVMLPDDFIDYYVAAFSLDRTAIIEESASNDAKYLAQKTVELLTLLSADYNAAAELIGFHVGVMLEKLFIESAITSVFQLNIMPYDGEENYVTIVAYTMFEGKDSKTEIGFDFSMEADYPVRDIYIAE